jgi:hypothetical protein
MHHLSTNVQENYPGPAWVEGSEDTDDPACLRLVLFGVSTGMV